MKCRVCESERPPFVPCLIDTGDEKLPQAVACIHCLKRFQEGALSVSDVQKLVARNPQDAPSKPAPPPKKKDKEIHDE